jgi:hypothetical protein
MLRSGVTLSRLLVLIRRLEVWLRTPRLEWVH